MTDNPLKIIQKKESELSERLRLKNQEAVEKIADFKKLQQKVLDNLPSSLVDEIDKIKSDLSIQADREIKASRIKFEKQIARLDEIDTIEISRLSNKIVENLIGTVK